MSYTIYICNAFSLSMLDREAQRKELDAGGRGRVPRPIDDPVAFLRSWEAHDAEIVSAVGHADTARVFSKILGRDVEQNRVNVKLGLYKLALIGQYIGPRLPEGTTELPEGAKIEWWVI